jgi:hypothetical protein
VATFNKFNQFVQDLATKVHNLNSDTIKVMLSNTAPVATNSVKANITEITAANGYPAGGRRRRSRAARKPRAPTSLCSMT